MKFLLLLLSVIVFLDLGVYAQQLDKAKKTLVVCLKNKKSKSIPRKALAKYVKQGAKLGKCKKEMKTKKKKTSAAGVVVPRPGAAKHLPHNANAQRANPEGVDPRA